MNGVVVREEIDAEDFREEFIGCVDDCFSGADARVVDEDGGFPDFASDGLTEIHDGCLVGDVAFVKGDFGIVLQVGW